MRSSGRNSGSGSRSGGGGSGGGNRDGRSDRTGRDGRGERDTWVSRDERDDRRGRDDRGSRDDRSGRDDRRGRDERAGRDDRGSRDARGSRDDRASRDGRGFRDERGGRGERGAGAGRDGRDGRDSRDSQPKRPSRPRPEERRYDVGRTGTTGGSGASGAPLGARRSAGSGGARGAAARGGAKGGPRPPQSAGRGGPRRGAAARPRELDAKIEQRNRDRYAERPSVKTPKTFPGAEQEGERLQKVLARAGMGSRRACEELIEQSRVEVNGKIVVEQGMRVDPEKDEIKVDGLTVATQSYLFFALNKPAGVVSTMEDPDGRQSLGDYVTNRETRLFHVGRLDTETEGIILLTNHGELAHRLTHPKYGVKKIYLAAIQGPLPRDLGKRLKDGIQLEDGYAKADHFRVVENTGKNYLVEVTLHEGRKHIVRRMLAEAGFPVDRLVRTSFGPIPLGDQKSGWLRRLTNTEVGMLMKEVGL
ncbi:rRNA pseudouridine synthase [Streptomyces sp. GMY02]|uniref:pseudouridine synthase n=1 Tax=Streptomyces sp. GMY02 TaxID=1333528 RepID=UPI001C2BC3F2|nr:pseudouridine synthase [Streptomyces sp. GMY02]QXE37576.1 rRNA pseudouridine synthase [Streptomyces sp. GMY02]